MKNALFALAILVPALVRADDRPYTLTNGRSAGTAAAAAAWASAPRTSAAVTPMAVTAGSFGTNSVVTGGSLAAIGRRASGGRPQGHKSFWGGKRSAEPTPAPTTEEAPAYFSKPGAWIRTEGQQPKYADAGPARTTELESGTAVGGSAIHFNESKGQDVGRSDGVRWGPKDTPPSPNPGTTGGSGSGSSITPNSTINITNNTTNGNQSGGKDDEHKNNDGFGGGTGFDPAF